MVGIFVGKSDAITTSLCCQSPSSSVFTCIWPDEVLGSHASLHKILYSILSVLVVARSRFDLNHHHSNKERKKR